MLREYFIDPIINGTGYNIVNTIVYALIFALAVIGIYKLLEKWKIKTDRKFWTGVFPYIILGSLLRTLQDAHVLNNPLFITPLIYVLMFSVALLMLVFSRQLEKYRHIEYHKTWAVSGFLLVVITLFFFRIQNPAGFLIIGIFAVWTLVIVLIRKFVSYSTDNTLLLLAHIFDATTTFVSIQFFNYYEQHVLAGSVINALGPWAMYLLKIPAVILVLWILDRETLNKKEAMSSENSFIKLIILILGLGPGLRNFFRLVMGV